VTNGSGTRRACWFHHRPCRLLPVTESIALPPDLRRASCHPLIPIHSTAGAEIGILACSKCGNPMRLSQIEPAAPGYDVRLSNARSAIPSSVFRSLSKRDFYAGLEQTSTLEIWALSRFRMPMCRFGRPLAYAYHRGGKRANASPFRLGPSRNDPGV
jgi:hypothetical protein